MQRAVNFERSMPRNKKAGEVERVDAAFLTHVGCVRKVNEDTGMIFREYDGWLAAAIADGMGGHQAGDIASRMAVDAIYGVVREAAEDEMSVEKCQDVAERAVRKANDDVFRHARENPECRGMGTTVALVLAADDRGVVAHIGDSRVYALKDQLRRLTQDHSLVNELIQEGRISEAEADVHPHKNVLIRALGTEPDVHVDVNPFQWKKGEQLLLCSDGLTNKVSDRDIEKRLNGDTTPQEKCETLVQEALEAGGEDNISVIVIDNQMDSTQVERKLKG